MEGAAEGRTRYSRLLADSELKRWYDNVRRGSPVTADVYLRRLGSTCLGKGTSPGEMLDQARGDADGRWAFNFLADLVTELEGEKKAGSYIASNVKAVKSWLSHNGVEIKGRLRIKGAHETPSLANKHAPSLPELGRLFSLVHPVVPVEVFVTSPVVPTNSPFCPSAPVS